MRLLARLIRLPLRLIPAGWVVPILSGSLRGRRWVTGSATHGCWLGTYERDTQLILREHIGTGGVVYDLGANVGFFTLLASKLVGRSGVICSFEPLPRNLDYLERHLQLNEIENVRVFPVAVSAQSGTARFASAQSPSMGGLRAAGDIEVKTETLDGLFASGAIPPPTLMKIDVEGAEYEVLTGAARVLAGSRPVILLSAHGYTQRDRCSTLLREAGYELETVINRRDVGDYVILAIPSRTPPPRP